MKEPTSIMHLPVPELGDPRAQMFDNGRQVSPWWIARHRDGSPFWRRWVRTADGWDYEDREPWEW